MKIKVIRKRMKMPAKDWGWSCLTTKVPLWLRSFENYTTFEFDYADHFVSYQKRFQRDWRSFVKLKRNKNCEVDQDANNQQLKRIGLWEM